MPGMPKDAWESSGNKVHRAREAAYARKVDTALREVLSGSDLPLILAASQPMAALFRSVSTYPHLVAEREHGSPDTTSDAELADAARAILDDVYADQLAELAAEFDAAPFAGPDRGRPVRHRPPGHPRCGRHGAGRHRRIGARSIDEAGAVTFADGEDADSYGVVDEIVRRVLLSGGHVLAVRADDIPDGGPAAAILRYAI